MRNILVVGNAGFVGSHVEDELLFAGVQPILMDAGWFCDPSAQTVVKNIHHYNTDDLIEFLGSNDVSHIIYLAGFSNDPMADYKPHLNFYHNLSVPSWVGHCAQYAGVERFVFASSTSCYQTNRPLQPYALAKSQVERCLSVLNIETCYVRCATLGGASRRMRFDLCVNSMVKSAISTGTIDCWTPEATRPLMSARDAAKCYIEMALDHRSGVVTAFTEHVNVREIADRVANRLEIHDINVGVEYGIGSDARSVPEGIPHDWCGTETIEDMVDSVVEHVAYQGIDVTDEQYLNIKMMEEKIAQGYFDASTY